MASFTTTKRIAAPVETVFDLATDLAHAAEHVRGIEKIEQLTPGPIGVGTKWRETRRMMGKEANETLEITAFNRPHSYTVGCHSCGAYMETKFRFTPIGNATGPPSATAGLPSSASAATDLTVDIRCEARSAFAKLMSPLTGLMFGKMMRGCIESDIEDIRRVAESRATVAT